MSECISEPFKGTRQHKLDAKGRVAVPANWRPEGTMDLLLKISDRAGFEVLRFFTQERMNALLQKVENDPDFTEAEKRSFIGNINESCTEVSINSQGKLQIPKSLIEEKQLKSDVTIVGRGAEFEIHHPQTYLEILEKEAPKIRKLNAKYSI